MDIQKESVSFAVLFCFLCSSFLACLIQKTYAQDPGPPLHIKSGDSMIMQEKKLDLFSGDVQIDLIDVGRYIFNKKAAPRKDTTGIKTGKLHFSVLPSVEYTLQTGFAGALNANVAFYTSNHQEANLSSIIAVVKYTQKNQFLLPIAGNIWSNHNKYNLQTDWRFEKFPQTTYGLGQFTNDQDGYTIDYTYIRLYQTLFKTIFTDFYLGFGYDLDYYWNIREVDPPANDTTDFQKYGLTSRSVSAGFTFSLQYDTRRNSINPHQGYYANIIYRPNFTFTGSDANWQSLLIDLRKYIQLPGNSKNILAFWNYDWLTISGKPPYLNLPITAGDTYNNLGRGYIQARFRGSNMLYLETEYRFGITSNGLIGGVVFANAQSFNTIYNSQFEVISPGFGAGIRVKLNKFSNTNVALDYGFGAHGSRGIFANLGEVF
jgi:outer membrane protein assembly factor BamA